jgi:hypothetical protein
MIHGLSASFPEEFHSLCTRAFFAKFPTNPHVFHWICTSFPYGIGVQFERDFSSAFSFLFLGEKGRKAGGIHKLWKSE